MPFHRLALLTTAALFGFSLAATAQVYSWTDEDGNRVFSDQHSSSDAKTTLHGNPVNYYSAPQPQKSHATPTAETHNTLATLEAVAAEGNNNQAAEKPLTEQQCQEIYRRNCDEVVNWEKYAREACNRSERCNDPAYLEHKYRPRTVEELNKIARRAGARQNRQEKKIALFLKKRYTNYCEEKAENFCGWKDSPSKKQQLAKICGGSHNSAQSSTKQFCQLQNSSDCKKQIKKQCHDPRSLEQVLAQYGSLNDNEKRLIIEKAKQLAKTENNGIFNYDDMISSLLDILVSQALLGI